MFDELYIIYGKKLHAITHRSQSTPELEYVGRESVPFMYLHCLAGRAKWPEKQSMDEVAKRKNMNTRKRGYEDGEWSEIELR